MRAVNSKEPTVIRSILMLYFSPSFTLQGYSSLLQFIAPWIKPDLAKVHLEIRAQHPVFSPSTLAQLNASQEEVGDSSQDHAQLEANVGPIELLCDETGVVLLRHSEHHPYQPDN